MCDLDNCEKIGTTFVESGHLLCDEHVAIGRRFICKHCKVGVRSREDRRAVIGLRHQLDCPRSRSRA